MNRPAVARRSILPVLVVTGCINVSGQALQSGQRMRVGGWELVLTRYTSSGSLRTNRSVTSCCAALVFEERALSWSGRCASLRNDR